MNAPRHRSARTPTALRIALLSLVAAFSALSIFSPRLLPTALQLEDFVLIAAASTAAFADSTSPLGRRLFGALAVSVLIVGVSGALALRVSTPPLAFVHPPGGSAKDAGRLAKLALTMFVGVRTAGMISTTGRSHARAFALALLTCHAAMGLAQAVHLPVLDSYTTNYFMTDDDDPQKYNLSERAITDGYFRATGTVYNPNIYGALAVILFTTVRILGAGALETACAAVLLATAVYLSKSRTALILATYIVASAALKEQTGGRRTRLAALISIALIAIGATALDRSGWASRLDTLGTSDRPQYFDIPPAVMADSPFLGFGLGAQWVFAADSDYLVVLMQTGLVGLLAVGWFYLRAWKLLQPVGASARACLIAGAAIGASNGVLFGNELAPFLLLALALGTSSQLATVGLAQPWRADAGSSAGIS